MTKRIFLPIFACLSLMFFRCQGANEPKTDGLIIEVDSTDLIDENDGSKQETIIINPNHPFIRYNGVLSSKISDSEAELYRFTEGFLELYEQQYDYTWNPKKARTNSGISISFRTTSQKIKMKFDTLENSDIRARNFCVFKNGELWDKGISKLEFEITNPDGDDANWEIYLPIFSGVKFLGLELLAGILEELPADNAPKYVAIGNSITHGVGQSAAIDTYPYRVADALGYRLINLGIGGSRISTSTLKNLSSVSPVLITVLWGYNDVNNPNPLEKLAFPRYEELIRQLCITQPQAKVYCIMQPFTTTVVGKNNENNTIESLRTNSREIVDMLQREFSNLYILAGVEYVTSNSDLNDVVHLNVTGARKLADGIISEYQSE